MAERLDLTGQRFGRLVVIKEGGKNKHNQYVWECKCDCGNVCKINGGSLKDGRTKSCGCITRKHGQTKERIYNLWWGIKQRCFDANSKSYKRYGGRGITVCDEWINEEKGFINFRDWSMANGYNEILSIDRIDNDKGYSPDNCRWVTMMEQQNNKRNNINVEINGKTLTLEQWSKIARLDSESIRQRYHKGIRGSALIAPRQLKKITINGKSHILEEWSKITGIPLSTLWNRYNAGKREIDLIAPIRPHKEIEKIEVEIDGKTYTLPELSETTGIKTATLYQRYRQGKQGAELSSSTMPTQIEINGELHSWSEWENTTGIKSKTLQMRYKRGKRGKALIAPLTNNKK